MLIRRGEKGDTMIEVLFAVMIFSAVAVAGLTIMNQGASAAQRSLEVTLVRHEIDAQSEALRLMYDDAMAQHGSRERTQATERWEQVLSHRKVASAITPWSGLAPGGECIAPGSVSGAFIINTHRGVAEAPSGVWRESASTYARILYTDAGLIGSLEGVWIEAAQHAKTGTIPGYTDFYIRTCWDAIGQNNPVTIGTTVRLYEP